MLDEIHRATFLDSAPVPSFDEGYWWLAFHGSLPAAFAGLVQSTHAPNAGYLCRVGVMRKDWGRSLQLRLLRAAARRARRSGWHRIVSDTTNNVISANNFIRAGYRLYRPSLPWGWANALLAQIRVRAAVPAGHTGQSCMIPFARWPSAAGPFCVLGGVVQALQPAKSSRPKPQGSMSSPPLWPARNRT
jgi:Acetyltransferase (GNAT) family